MSKLLLKLLEIRKEFPFNAVLRLLLNDIASLKPWNIYSLGMNIMIQNRPQNNLIYMRRTHSLAPARARFLSLQSHFGGDGAAVEVRALVLLVHPDQSTHVRVGRGGFLQRSVLLLRLEVLLLPGQQAVPNFNVSRRVGAVPAVHFSGRVLAVPPGQERAHTS